MKILFILIMTFFMQSCGSFLDVSEKGAKTRCLKLSTDNLTIDCNCVDKQIETMTIYSNKNSKEVFGPKISDASFKPTTEPVIEELQVELGPPGMATTRVKRLRGARGTDKWCIRRWWKG